MKNNYSLLFLSVFFIIGNVTSISAQQSVTASGGNATGTGGSVSFAIGQLGYQNYSGNAGSVLEGVQQPYEIFELSIADHVGIALDCQVYPNPTNDVLQLRITNYELQMGSGVWYAVCDLTGRQIIQQEIVEELTEISMGNLSKGTYLLNIMIDNRPAKAFKIIKN
ncbi:MAG: T9SS type A sorting domain-containing protein [Bacteroidetes bacterium]|nr:T9SS type A sorting domain-containing protein [Bacteroidota bacterium]